MPSLSSCQSELQASVPPSTASAPPTLPPMASPMVSTPAALDTVVSDAAKTPTKKSAKAPAKQSAKAPGKKSTKVPAGTSTSKSAKEQVTTRAANHTKPQPTATSSSQGPEVSLNAENAVPTSVTGGRRYRLHSDTEDEGGLRGRPLKRRFWETSISQASPESWRDAPSWSSNSPNGDAVPKPVDDQVIPPHQADPEATSVDILAAPLTVSPSSPSPLPPQHGPSPSGTNDVPPPPMQGSAAVPVPYANCGRSVLIDTLLDRDEEIVSLRRELVRQHREVEAKNRQIEIVRSALGTAPSI